MTVLICPFPSRTNSFRRTSQKPADALLADFRQQFPEVASAGTAAATEAAVAVSVAAAVAPATTVENPIINVPVPAGLVFTKPH